MNTNKKKQKVSGGLLSLLSGINVSLKGRGLSTQKCYKNTCWLQKCSHTNNMYTTQLQFTHTQTHICEASSQSCAQVSVCVLMWTGDSIVKVGERPPQQQPGPPQTPTQGQIERFHPLGDPTQPPRPEPEGAQQKPPLASPPLSSTPPEGLPNTE